MIKDCFASLKEKIVLKLFVMDSIFVLFFYFATNLFGSLIIKQTVALTGGRTVDQIQQLILNNPEQAQAVVGNIKLFLFTFFGGVILILVSSYLLFSLSRFIIWNKLLNKKFDKKRYWKWNLLQLLLLGLFIVYLPIVFVSKLLINFLIEGMPAKINTFLNLTSNLLLMLVFVTFVFLVYYSFTKKYQVWNSVADVFALVKKKWTKLWKYFLLVLGTGLLLNLILMLLQPVLTNIVLNIAIFLLFLSWARAFLVKKVLSFR